MRTILFVCQFNSARSQLAEAIARSMIPEGVRVLSAGLTKTVVNTEVLQALKEVGLDASAQRSKTLEEVAQEGDIDDVVVLAKEAMDPARLAFPDAHHILCHLPDPIATKDPERLPVEVRLARDRIKSFLISWLPAEAAHP